MSSPRRGSRPNIVLGDAQSSRALIKHADLVGGTAALERSPLCSSASKSDRGSRLACALFIGKAGETPTAIRSPYLNFRA
jgi:hypothetical protein